MGQHYLMISSRYVGNTMATFIMQALGCEVAALNTVQFSRPSHLVVLPRPYQPKLLFSLNVSFEFILLLFSLHISSVIYTTFE